METKLEGMAFDIVFPENNEQAFLDMAAKLGYAELYFAYPLSSYKEKSKQQYKSPVKVNYGIIAQPKDILRAKSITPHVVVQSSDDNRLVIEKFRPWLVYNLETGTKKDFMHQRNSGLNHVLCALAHQHGVGIGFNYSLLQSSERRSIILGRMMQNMMLCKKFALNVVFASFATSPWQLRGRTDVESLGRIL